MLITLPDGTQKEMPANSALMDTALSISENFAKAACGGFVNGTFYELNRPIESDAEVKLVTFKDKEGAAVFHHTASHIMAAAVKNLFKDVQIAIGPAIKNGFYYDFDNIELKEENFAAIEEEMKKIVADDHPVTKRILTNEEALELFKDEPYKLELIKEFPADETISCYTIADFTDLCRGPHLPSTGRVKAFKLLRIAGAYWRGKSENRMLTRVYATAFPHKKELKAHLQMLEEAAARDHNRLGRELDLFITDPIIGQGLPLLTPKGATLKRVLQRFIEDEELKRGYQYTMTPFLAKKDLYQISGHWDFYRDGMFVMEEDNGETLALRPMTCPFQFSIYNSQKRSYRELPIRYGETSTLFRNESSGEMHGLIRIRQFTLSEWHVICRPDQVEAEFKEVLELIRFILSVLDFKEDEDFHFRFSKWDPNDKKKYVDNPEGWQRTQEQMKWILDQIGIPYTEADGEAAFYGPKLDIQMKNVYGKEDTIITIQIDFALPGRFKMRYIDESNQTQEPVIIHRSSIGCYERTMALLIEKTNGKFPFWLAPQQIVILTVTDRVRDYAAELNRLFLANHLRSEIDSRSESLKKKVRDAQLSRIPCILTIGDKEKEAGSVSVRTLAGNLKFGIPHGDFIKTCREMTLSYAKENAFDKDPS